jgi:hypothetical protein
MFIFVHLCTGAWGLGLRSIKYTVKQAPNMGRILLLNEDTDASGTMDLSEASSFQRDSSFSSRRTAAVGRTRPNKSNSGGHSAAAMPTDKFTQADVNSSRVMYEHTGFTADVERSIGRASGAASGLHLVDRIHLVASTEFAPDLDIVSIFQGDYKILRSDISVCSIHC